MGCRGGTPFCVTMETTVVNLNHEEYDIYIGRRGKGKNGYYGNPIEFGERCLVCGEVHQDTEQGRLDLLDCYKRWFWNRVNKEPVFRQKVRDLRGYRLGCFCKPKPCHGDVIKAWLDAGLPLRDDFVRA